MERGNSHKGAERRAGWLRHAAAALLAFALAFGGVTGAWAAEGDSAPSVPSAAETPAGPSRSELDAALGSLQASLGQAGSVSDWVALAMARSGKPAGAKYLPQAEKAVSDGSLRLVTDYARIALAVNANGGDVRNFGKNKMDLLSAIANFEKMTAQGPNAPAYALMALDAGDYAPGLNDRWSRDSLIQWLVDNRNADGGWSLAKGKSDVDVTGIVLTALAPYLDRDGVRTAVDAALGWLSGQQRDNGGFGTSLESSESSVQVLIALTSLGIDPETDARFLKNGKSALARLMEFRNSDGSFAHVPGGKSDSLSSLYAFLGLTAVERFQDGLPRLYAGLPAGAGSEVRVFGPSSQRAVGHAAGRTALESLLTVLRSNGIPYKIQKHPQLGPMLTEVAGIGSGSLDGYWLFAVQRGGEWVDIVEGMGSFVPQAGDEISVYYAGGNTALIHSVKLDPVSPRAGQTVKVAVEKETFDWESGKKVVGPAEGATVRVSGQSVVTDKEGLAQFTAPAAGSYMLSVVGYKQDSTPDYLAVQLPIEVSSYTKNVQVRIEGDKGALASGTAQGGTALEALESFLKARNIPYEVKEMSFGKYVASIGGTAAGQFGGYDGWLYAVKDGGSWINPAEGIGTFLLEEGQELVVYYGDNTKLPEPVVVTPASPKPGEPVSVAVTYREMDWTTGKPGEPKPLSGVQVSAGGVSAVTDEAGKATLAGLPEGIHQLTVSGYASGKAPSAVRTSVALTVAASYSDEGKISPWAADWVRTARASGVLRGPNDSAASFQGKGAVTRAEFVTALVRALGIAPAEGFDFKDVPKDAWYAKHIQAASQAGLIAGVSPGKFAPDAKLTREQAAQLIARVLKITAQGSLSFADSAAVSAGAKPSVQAVLEQGWMTLNNDKFLPKQTVTREQAAIISVRILTRPGVGKLGQ